MKLFTGTKGDIKRDSSQRVKLCTLHAGVKTCPSLHLHTGPLVHCFLLMHLKVIFWRIVYSWYFFHSLISSDCYLAITQLLKARSSFLGFGYVPQSCPNTGFRQPVSEDQCHFLFHDSKQKSEPSGQSWMQLKFSQAGVTISLSNPNKSLTCLPVCSWKECHQKQSHDQQDM